MSYSKSIRSLINQIIEIDCGPDKKTLKYSDSEITQKTVVRGRLIECLDDCLIVECYKYNASANKTHKNKVYINTFSIVAVCVPDETMSLTDMFICENTKQVK